MFKGEKNKTANDSPERLNRLVNGTKLEGDLSTESNLRVDGMIKGNIHCKSKFVLGTEGVVKGNLFANSAELEGAVEGDISADELLILRKTAIIKGNIISGRLIIEDGAQIEGSVQTGEMPDRVVGNEKKSDKNIAPQKPTAKDDRNDAVQSDVVY